MLLKKLLILSIIFLPLSGFARERACHTNSVQNLSVSKNGAKAASYCLNGNQIHLKYNNAKRTITIVNGKKRITVTKIDKGYTPDLIGSTASIRFLPSDIQPYVSRGIVLFNTVERSTGGNGSGQCGSGAEVYLNAANVLASPIKLLGRVKIESCRQDIALTGKENGLDDFSSFSVQEGRLAIKFLYFSGNFDDPTGLLSDDFRNIEFLGVNPSPTN